VDSSRSHDPRLVRAAQPGATRPAAQAAQPPRRTSPSVYPYEQPQQPPRSTYPYEQQVPRQQVPQQVPPPPPQRRTAPRTSPARKALGVLVFLALTALSVPLHIAAVFFVYVEFESPGDPVMAVLLIGGAFIGAFAALFVTGLLTQLVGAFPGRWRARVTFAALSGAIALAVAYFAALRLF